MTMRPSPRPVASRRTCAFRPTRLVIALLGFAIAWGLVQAPTARSAWEPSGADLTRPRILFRADQLADIQAVLDLDPLPEAIERSLDEMDRRIGLADGVALDDHRIAQERFKARAAKSMAFYYAVDRTRVGGEVVPFPSAAERQAVGDRVRDWLLNMFTRSRIAITGELGGWDRDISTSEELLQWATAYDTLAGAGYDFGADEEVIVGRIVQLASRLYLNYTDPSTANGLTLLHQNNHRSKVGAALVVAAIAVAEHTPEAGTDARGIRDPADWVPYGLDQVDLIIRNALMTGDGAYAEGPFYWRFSSENLLTMARAWHALVGDVEWPIGGGLTVPSFWTHPLFRQTHRWMLDMTLPDGSLVHIDDGNPGRSHFFGAAPADPADAPAFAWRAANAPRPWETDGNIDMGPDTIVLYDPTVTEAPPVTPPTVFYEEGGHAILKSGWDADATMVVINAESDTASEFGVDRDGNPVVPESHEHAEPGSFLLYAFGQRLAIDPGYISFGERERVNQGRHHNIILVDGEGPVDYLGASLAWGSNPGPRPPADGHAFMSDTLDSAFLDAVRVTTRYGMGEGVRPSRAPLIQRRFLFPDHRYLIAADTVTSADGTPHAFTWPIHGAGGGTAYDGGSVDGTFESTSTGGRWTRSLGRLDGAVDVAEATPVFTTDIEDYEESDRRELTHVVSKATATGESLRALLLAYPTPSAEAAPEVTALDVPGAAALRVLDSDGDRRILAWHREASGDDLAVTAGESGLADAVSDGQLALFDAADDGALRLAWAEQATHLAYAGVTYLRRSEPGRIGIALSPDRADVVAEGGSGVVAVDGLDFTPRSADGACALVVESGQPPRVDLGRDRRFSLRAAADNSRPAAHPGDDVAWLAPGQVVTLDGRASCDADGDTLTPSWRLVSAPARGAWKLEDADGWTPRLTVDQPGAYRVSLTVTDENGASSLPVEVRLTAGAPCEDGLDDDLDGLIDTDDPGCTRGAALFEEPACQNGADDDGDGLTDHPADPECRTRFSHSERWARCGLGAELVVAVLAIAGATRRRQRRAARRG